MNCFSSSNNCFQLVWECVSGDLKAFHCGGGGLFTACRDNTVSVVTGGPEHGKVTYCISIPLYFVKAGTFDIFPFIYEKYEPIFICTS